MFGFRKVRHAEITPEHRDLFERYGETVVQLVVSSGHSPTAPELQAIYQVPAAKKEALLWLTERADINANHERRIEYVEWAISIFVIASVGLEIYSLWFAP